ncbi:MAG: hypothetical protein RIT04_676 [Candidatus Parcubacteria bacterium]|jgi:aspartyl/glutamyl-tRNA(Asn/Gln) amidotransferase C subunit
MITEKDVQDLANLSRIKLSPNETQALMKEIGSILTYVDEIKKAPVGDAEMSQQASVGVIRNVTRDDISRDISSETREAILNAAPDREGDFVAVKRILS